MTESKQLPTSIIADAAALQERDEFRAQGWLKLVAPAKVNLHLAIGPKRDDGYHEAVSIMHAVNLHDVVYMRRKTPDCASYGSDAPEVRLVSCGDVTAPAVASEDNIASKAVVRLAEALGRPASDADLEIRIEKNIPFQAGLGGGSTDAAAALLGAARLWGASDELDTIEQTARGLGADVAFFLHGGCSVYDGAGDAFVRAIRPSKQAVALVKPDGGVSTAQAYDAFDAHPVAVPDAIARQAREATAAEELDLFNNLAEASATLLPELADIRSWLMEQSGVRDALLCGSGAATFARCEDFAAACRVVADARKRGLWARATSFGTIRAMAVTTGDRT